MNGTQAKVCLFVAIFKFKVALLDRVTQTVQTRLRSDRDYNTTIGSIRGYLLATSNIAPIFGYQINRKQNSAEITYNHTIDDICIVKQQV